MIEERSIGKMILLTFVTCGIYGIIWQLNIANDIKTLNGTDKPNGGMDILLTILTCGLYGIYVWFQYPTLLNQALQAKGHTTNENLPIISVVCVLFGLAFVSIILVQTELNKVATGA